MNKEVYRHLWKTYGRDWRIAVGWLFLVIQTIIIRVVVVIIVAEVTTKLAAGDIETAKQYTLYYLFAYLLGVAVGTSGELLSNRAENNIYGIQLVRYHHKLTHKDMAFYRDHQTGYLATTFRQYLDSGLLLLRFWKGEILGTIISLCLPIVVLLIASPVVGLTAMGVVAIQVIYIFWSSRKANKLRMRAHEVYRKITGEISDEITNIVAFKSSGVDAQARKNISLFAEEETSLFKKRHRMVVLLDFPRGIMTSVGISLALYFVITTSDTSNPASLGLIVMTLTYMFQIIRSVYALPSLVTSHDDLVTKLYPSLKNLGEEYESIKDPENPIPLQISDARIDINKMSFSYPSHNDNSRRIAVFHDLSITVKGGEQIGIVGLSGAGKSTLASLLLRFDDISSGSITIDNTDIRQVTQNELRQNIAYVPQEPLLFHRTIKENIAYFMYDCTDTQIEQAAKAAHAHEFISKLPGGYNTMVGERGVKLSGGQKQRIAIARAIIKNAPIMLFDEATSALDSESEQIIQKALPEILGKRTAIIIAHRLSTVAKLDRIIVLHNGKIIEEGTHAALLKQMGRYYSLWQKQTTTEK